METHLAVRGHCALRKARAATRAAVRELRRHTHVVLCRRGWWLRLAAGAGVVGRGVVRSVSI